MKDRFTSVPRGDLAAAIYRTIENRVETLFDNSISAIDKRASGRARLLRARCRARV